MTKGISMRAFADYPMINATYDDEWTIRMPAGLRLKHAPPSKALASPFGWFTRGIG